MIKINQAVSVGRHDYAVVNFRTIKRGRRAGQTEYTLAPMKRTGKSYGLSVKGHEWALNPPSREYTEEEIKQAIDEYMKTDEGLDNYKKNLVDRRTKATKEIEVGDEVLVRYANAPARWELVVKKNYKTGKVAIYRGIGFLNKELLQEFVKNLEAGVYKGRTAELYRWIRPEVIIESRDVGRRIK